MGKILNRVGIAITLALWLLAFLPFSSWIPKAAAEDGFVRVEVTVEPATPVPSLKLQRQNNNPRIDGAQFATQYTRPENAGGGKFVFPAVSIELYCNAESSGQNASNPDGPIVPQDFAKFNLIVESGGRRSEEVVDLTGNCRSQTKRVTVNMADAAATPDLVFRLKYRDWNEEGGPIRPLPNTETSIELRGVDGNSYSSDEYTYVEQNGVGVFRFPNVPEGKYEYEVRHASQFYCDNYRLNYLLEGQWTLGEYTRGIAIAGTVEPSPDSYEFCAGYIDFNAALEDDDTESCSENFPSVVGWAVCTVVDWVDSAVNKLVDTLNGLLSVGPSEVNTDEMREAWSFFRNLASLLLVVIGLIMIIGQAGSKE